MPKPPHVPWGQWPPAQPRKAGAGLGQFLPETPAEPPTPAYGPLPEPADVPTKKMVAVPVRDKLCPSCGGATELHVGAYQTHPCPTCEATGMVAAETFERYLIEHPESLAAKQLKHKT